MESEFATFLISGLDLLSYNHKNTSMDLEREEGCLGRSRISKLRLIYHSRKSADSV